MSTDSSVMTGFSALILVFLALFFPPLAVFAVAGCGPDIAINIILLLFLWTPGQLHALYVIFVYYDRKSHKVRGSRPHKKAPGVFSKNVVAGGHQDCDKIELVEKCKATPTPATIEDGEKTPKMVGRDAVAAAS